MFKVVFCYKSEMHFDVCHVCIVEIPMIYILSRMSCDLNG